MAQQVKPLSVTPASHTGVPIARLLIQLLAKALGGAADDGPSSRLPACTGLALAVLWTFGE